MLGVCVVTIIFGIFLQIQLFPKVKWEKTAEVNWSVPFSILYSFIFNIVAVGIFDRPYWPVLIPFGCFLFSRVIMAWVADLAGWFDRLTMMLMLSGMILEFLCRRCCCG